MKIEVQVRVVVTSKKFFNRAWWVLVLHCVGQMNSSAVPSQGDYVLGLPAFDAMVRISGTRIALYSFRVDEVNWQHKGGVLHPSIVLRSPEDLYLGLSKHQSRLWMEGPLTESLKALGFGGFTLHNR